MGGVTNSRGSNGGVFSFIPPVIFRRRTPAVINHQMRPALVVLLPLVAAVQPQGPRLGLESFAKLLPTPAATAKPPVAASRRPATTRLTSTRPVAAPVSPLSRLFASGPLNTRSKPPPIAVPAPARAKGFQFGTAPAPVRLGLETLGPQRLLATLLVAAALGNAPTLESTYTPTTRIPSSVSSMMPTNDARFEAAMERQRARLVVAEESMRKYEQQVSAAKLRAEKAAKSRADSREERLQRTIAQTPRVMEQQQIFPDSKLDDTFVDDAVVASELVAEMAPEVNVPKVMAQPMVDPLPNKVPAEALRPTQPGTSPTQAAAAVLALGTVSIGGALLQTRKNGDGERTFGTLDAPFTTKTMMTPPETTLGTVAARVSKPPPPRAPASTPPSGDVVRRAAAASSAEAAAQAAVEEIGDALKRAVEEARDRAARAEEEAIDGARTALELKRRNELLAEARAAEAERARAAEAALFEAVAEAQAAADAMKMEEARIARARAKASATRNAKGAYLANADEKAQRLDGVKAAEELKRVAAAERRAMEEARVAREARAAFETAEEVKRVAAAEKRAMEEARVAREAEEELKRVAAAEARAVEEARVAREAAEELKRVAAAEARAVEEARVAREAAVEEARVAIEARAAAAEKIAAERAAAERAAAEKIAAEKIANEKIAAEKIANEKIANEKIAAEKIAAERIAAEKIALEKAAAAKIAAERAAAEKAFAKAAAVTAEKAAKIAADKADWADLKSISRATSKKPKVSPSPTPSQKAAPVIQKAAVLGGGVEGAGGAPLTPTQLNKLKVAELRSELASRGLDSKGIKATLVARLAEAIKQAQDAAEAAKAEAAKAAAATSKGSKGSGRPKPVGFGQFVQPRKGSVGTKKRVKKWYDI